LVVFISFNVIQRVTDVFLVLTVVLLVISRSSHPQLLENRKKVAYFV